MEEKKIDCESWSIPDQQSRIDPNSGKEWENWSESEEREGED